MNDKRERAFRTAIDIVNTIAIIGSIGGHVMTPIVHARYCHTTQQAIVAQAPQRQAELHAAVERTPDNDPAVCRMIENREAAKHRQEQQTGVSHEVLEMEKHREAERRREEMDRLRDFGAAAAGGPDPSKDLARQHDAERRRAEARQRAEPPARRQDQLGPRRQRGR